MKLTVETRKRGYSDRATKGRVYVWPANESVLENLVNRHSRPIKLYRKAALQALADLGITDVKLSWSQRAGCSCPCSPGFIADGTYGALYRTDVYVTIDDAEVAA